MRAEMPPPYVVVHHVSKRFGKVQALDAVTLDVRNDELLVVLGPVGAGKTTLLRLIAGLEQPDEGTIRIHSEDVESLAPSQRDVALVFQNFSLYPDWTVRQNLEFPLKAPGRKLPREEIRERVEWAAKLLDIGSILDKSASHLSGGQMQRVAIGRAIVRKPRVFLFDEPLANLDAKLRESLRIHLVELRRYLRTPMIYVTHDQTEALGMAHRIAVLHEGKILQVGTPQQIYQNPISPTVARLLGQPPINLIPVTQLQSIWRLPDGEPLMPTTSTAASATLGIRPEHIRLTPSPTGPGIIHALQDMGPTVDMIVEFHGLHLHVSAPKPSPLAVGTRVVLTLDPKTINVWPT